MENYTTGQTLLSRSAKMLTSTEGSHQLIQVASKDRSSSSNSSSDFTILYGSGIRPTGTMWSLVGAVMPNTFYQINATNNVFEIREGAPLANVTVTIPVGMYTAATLCAALNTAINAASAGWAAWVVTYTASTMRLTFDSTKEGYVICTTLAGAAVTATNNLWKILGMTNSSGTGPIDSTNVIANYTAPYLVNLAIPLNFNIIMTVNGAEKQSVMINNSQQRATFVLPNYAGPGEIVTLSYEQLQHCVIHVGGNPITSISLRIYDDFGTTVDLHGAEWTLLFSQM